MNTPASSKPCVDISQVRQGNDATCISNAIYSGTAHFVGERPLPNPLGAYVTLAKSVKHVDSSQISSNNLQNRPKAIASFEKSFNNATAVICLPEKSHGRLRSTNIQERLYEKTRLRERVIRIFPNENPALGRF